MDACFTLLGRRRDGVSPTLDLVLSRSVEDALVEARAFLKQHVSCDAVEVWIEGRRLATIRRGTGEPRPDQDEGALIARIVRAMDPDHGRGLAEALQDLVDEAAPTERAIFAQWLAPLALAAEELGPCASADDVAVRARELRATRH